MVLKFWWLALVLVLLAPVAVWLFSRPRKVATSGTPVARLTRLTRLPAFRARLRRHSLMLAAAAGVVALTAGAAGVGIARPVHIEVINPERDTRDVMLCLDTSGSMYTHDAKILASYQTMVDKFRGERIGMTVFNATAVLVFPLTDDYDMVKEFLAEAETGMRTYGREGLDFMAGTSAPDVGGSSLIGDGLAACLDNFDRRDEERSRSVVFATDNMLAGTPIFSLADARQIAVDEKIRVYTLAPKAFFNSSEIGELKSVAQRTNGKHFELSSTSAADEIVSEIQQQEAKKTPGRTFTLVHDKPVVPLTLTTLGVLAALLLAWRLRI